MRLSSSSVSFRHLSFAGRLVMVLCAFMGVLVLAEASPAQKIDKSKLQTATRRSRKAAQVLSTVTRLGKEETIARELFERAKAVAVFPEVDKVNLLIQKAMQGYGVLSSRLAGGWTPPAYYGFGMAEFGFTSVETKKPDIIILFMSDAALKAFEKGGVRFKGEMVGFAGPVGTLNHEKENTIRTANAVVYALIDGKLKGIKVDSDFFSEAGLNPDNNINKAIYGLKAPEVVSGKAPLWPSVLTTEVSEFQNALTALSKK